MFAAPVLNNEKFTTIRKKPWPVGKPIMLYNWVGRPYGKGSTQRNVTAVKVLGFWPIVISHGPDGVMTYQHGMDCGQPLHRTEGFPSPEAMDDWFRKVVKSGQSETRYLMRFRQIAH